MPLLIQKNFDSWSVSTTIGYISRGVAFGIVKLEGDWWEHLTPTLVVSYSQITSNLSAVRALGLNERQVFASAGLAKDINPEWSIFIDAGRSIGRIDSASTSFECTVGVNFTGRLWGRTREANRKRFRFFFDSDCPVFF